MQCFCQCLYFYLFAGTIYSWYGYNINRKKNKFLVFLSIALSYNTFCHAQNLCLMTFCVLKLALDFQLFFFSIEVVRTGEPGNMRELRGERVPVPQVPEHQLRREGPVPVQHVRLLEIRQVRHLLHLQAVLRC